MVHALQVFAPGVRVEGGRNLPRVFRLSPLADTVRCTPCSRGCTVAWFASNKDLLGIGIAFLAILVSLTTVLISRRQQQARSFLAIQELMLSNDLQRGRLLIYSAGRSGNVPPTDSDDFKLMIRALAVFDLMGVYARMRIIRRHWVLDYWHPRLRVLRAGYEAVNFKQYASYPNHERPDLVELIDSAERYQCRRACCRQERPVLPTSGRGGEAAGMATSSPPEESPPSVGS